ncbi:hypothetical protein RJ641_014634 [Dillenia turbinata]|uniref:Uncharacterized protein n=1 Tax=Dillenia turbinata TaxID=194707 RepID=A0AAN8Z1E2_9MAGN
MVVDKQLAKQYQKQEREAAMLAKKQKSYAILDADDSRLNRTEVDKKRGRKVSRQEYLKKREQKKLEEIRDDIEDEQYLFDGVKLTDREYHEFRYKKQIYELVKNRPEESDDTNEGAYEEPFNPKMAKHPYKG